MSTTTIRLSEELKVRVAQAIAAKTEMDEMNAHFNADAEQRYAQILASGETIPWGEMKDYLSRRIAGEDVQRPLPKI